MRRFSEDASGERGGWVDTRLTPPAVHRHDRHRFDPSRVLRWTPEDGGCPMYARVDTVGTDSYLRTRPDETGAGDVAASAPARSGPALHNGQARLLAAVRLSNQSLLSSP